MEVSSALTSAVKIIGEILKQRISKTLADSGSGATITFPDAIHQELTQVLNWSSRIQFLGMAIGEDTGLKTLPLALDTTPRRFQYGSHDAVVKSEADLLLDDRHYIILGDPGAGKTTTLKRIAQRVLTENPADEADIYEYPLVVRLRELDDDSTISTELVKALGLQCRTEIIEVERPKPHKITHRYIGSLDLEHALADLLNTTNALILIDGLDEVHPEKKVKIEAELENLGRRLDRSKLILTSRSGDFQSNIDGFDVLELCPLTPGQIVEIAGSWLNGDSARFLKALEQLPYRDMTDRPLLLTRLLWLYKKRGELPNQPFLVCRNLLWLLLQEWDTERRFYRVSKYADFSVDRKLDFLAAISYELTYQIKAKVFSTDQLIRAYRAVHERFGLPRNEAQAVVTEIETHNGILVAFGDRYEFSHLSLQEYLCAEHLVRSPFPEKLQDYAIGYPAPLAVAVAISSSPSAWLAGLVLRGSTLPRFTEESIATFLRRLRQEQPQFDTSPLHAFSLLCLANRFRGVPAVDQELTAFFSSGFALASIGHVLTWYAATGWTGDYVRVERFTGCPDIQGFSAR